MTSERLTGRCTCGAVHYRLDRWPMFTHCCHCTQCQRLNGSAFALNTIIENEAIEVLAGDVVATPGPSESGRPHDIYRCRVCLTPLWGDYGRRPNYRFVRVGTLDEPSRLPPDVHVFTRSKLDWVRIPGEQPAFDTFYELEEQWPADALARRVAAVNP